ncbi:GNAT family N-acetyltransferase [Pseudalkalibacillus hwajinpoensis]|uniref:GNAT family N-acetyltransferase n=1 Tax=Guptibacillus hwajinpoensis TaxID=208199 RepID=A0A4U1MN51_9BACL|nr:GNAT family protein [Pseudalkalibacillus hwajinpoensis]TKD72224.1 GNAT family N-acetyltransferase [Pseudalkalibacillus hwajinpoensis]
MEKHNPIIETNRLILREVTSEDALDMYHYLSDEEVVKHMGLPPAQSVEEVMDEIEWYQSIIKEGTGIRWGVTLKDSGKVIGSCGYLNMQHKHYRAEVEFELNRNYWGKGIAFEALEAIIIYGFNHYQLERIEALIEPSNSQLQRLVSKLGFTKEGLLRHYEYTLGKFDDLYMYSIIKRDLIK